jgi:hypothetical protein
MVGKRYVGGCWWRDGESRNSALSYWHSNCLGTYTTPISTSFSDFAEKER